MTTKVVPFPPKGSSCPEIRGRARRRAPPNPPPAMGEEGGRVRGRRGPKLSGKKWLTTRAGQVVVDTSTPAPYAPGAAARSEQNTTGASQAPIPRVTFREDLLMFGGRLSIPSWLEAEELPTWAMPGSPLHEQAAKRK